MLKTILLQEDLTNVLLCLRCLDQSWHQLHHVVLCCKQLKENDGTFNPDTSSIRYLGMQPIIYNWDDCNCAAELVEHPPTCIFAHRDSWTYPGVPNHYVVQSRLQLWCWVGLKIHVHVLKPALEVGFENVHVPPEYFYFKALQQWWQPLRNELCTFSIQHMSYGRYTRDT